MTTLNELTQDAKAELRIRQRQVAMHFGDQVEKLLKAAKLKRVDLAKKLGKSRAWVTKLLFGPRNLTLFTAVEVADALGCDVELHLAPRQSAVDISCILSNESSVRTIVDWKFHDRFADYLECWKPCADLGLSHFASGLPLTYVINGVYMYEYFRANDNVECAESKALDTVPVGRSSTVRAEVN
jgi:plasmid maintenance system antidote protein VapI